MNLDGQPLLIIDSRINDFIHDLRTDLERAGADVVVAHGVTKALTYLARFEFSACLIGDHGAAPGTYRTLLKALRDMPIVFVGSAAGALDVPSVVQALKDKLARRT
jgi:hypothetical protein